MIFCSRDQTNYEQIFCQVACENKRNWDACPFRKPAQIQLDLSGKPVGTTSVILAKFVLAKRQRKALQNPGKWGL
jgi:hypothetical protein